MRFFSPVLFKNNLKSHSLYDGLYDDSSSFVEYSVQWRGDGQRRVGSVLNKIDIVVESSEPVK